MASVPWRFLAAVIQGDKSPWITANPYLTDPERIISRTSIPNPHTQDYTHAQHHPFGSDEPKRLYLG
ncbi:hypothetical protein ALP10_200192 [Pseudomonas syringae pv. helianthi]|uniref:Uncharacterized protein n=1 Tax=Pseudomonas syringae pv. helianthi TaxID=251654 RepID=A0A3M6CL95_9PSED|nr:hypothetical protein ALP10_200192 [Pseudomonas syringae pv. helianthi]RMW08488.1 hypothetical protein ALO98_200190 [Pseudomonas syringae pv. tagetis]